MSANYYDTSFSSTLWKSMASQFRAVRHDPNVRAVILCSNTRAFTAGLDLKQDGLSIVVSKMIDPARSALMLRDHVLEFQAAISTIEECEKPVIAAIHGVCYGLGIDIVSACDIRICSKSTRFSIKEVDAGLAADVGTLQRLPKSTGNGSLLRELALTARDFGTPEAIELGLLSTNQIVEGGQEEVWLKAEQLGRVIVAKSPVATLGTKHLLNYSRDHSTQDGLYYTALWSASALQAQDVKDSIKARLAKDDLVHFKPLGKL
ncbi:ClpP/crotonase-like domain-containing protein [Melampsora americana]|nr:ClpP/crotonase-like domain-containing protein [Melampsora americana]